MKTVIFDLDGTLADVSHRRRFKDDGSFDWKYFNDPENIKNDTPNKPIIDLYNHFRLGEKYKSVVLSGRMKDHFDITVDWFRKHVDAYMLISHTIIMREIGDYREDYIIKKEMLDNLLSKGHEIAFAIDDRDQIVELWRSLGITCLQCAKGNF